jgi:DNA-binding NtrC family response regulator
MKPEPVHILAVDDDTLAREFLSESFRRKGYQVCCAEDGRQALDLLKRHVFPIVITDLKMPRFNGLDLLKEAKRIHPEAEVIITTAYGSVEGAVEAVKNGAFDYLTKPFTRERIETLVERALERCRLRQETRQLKEELRRYQQAPPIIGRHPKMQAALELVSLAADTEATVLIRGESGTGKELMARSLHDCSRRRDRPIVKVSCAALPESLLEDELFGHERGAFTTAYQRRIGRFEKAHGGTIFLDEIGDLSPSTQIRLLNVLQDRQFERLGSSTPIPIDVRVVAATNRDLEKLMETQHFREDLYYRLKVVEIQLPPLRDRKEDIPLLAEHFLRQAAERRGKPVPELSKEGLAVLTEHDWPGNVRELENAIERAVIVSAGTRILGWDLLGPSQTTLSVNELPENAIRTLADGERALIQRALERTRWNRSSAARMLGVDRSTLVRKIRAYRLKQGGLVP